jgi:hypothetical protein
MRCVQIHKRLVKIYKEALAAYLKQQMHNLPEYTEKNMKNIE